MQRVFDSEDTFEQKLCELESLAGEGDDPQRDEPRRDEHLYEY